MEIAWLLEGKESTGKTIYFRGVNDLTNHRDTWTTDVYDALRFSRKEDAERFKQNYFKYAECYPAEHQWGG